LNNKITIQLLLKYTHGAYMNNLYSRLWITHYIQLTFIGFQIPLTFCFVWFAFWKHRSPLCWTLHFHWAGGTSDPSQFRRHLLPCCQHQYHFDRTSSET